MTYLPSRQSLTEVGRGWFEDFEIDAVVDGDNLSVFEEGSASFAGYPFANTCNCQPWDGKEVFPAIGKNLGRTVLQVCRSVKFLLGTVTTLLKPSVATGIGIVEASTSIEPTVVEGDDSDNITLCQIIEQHIQVNVVAVKIVKMDDVWLLAIHVFQE